MINSFKMRCSMFLTQIKLIIFISFAHSGSSHIHFFLFVTLIKITVFIQHIAIYFSHSVFSIGPLSRCFGTLSRSCLLVFCLCFFLSRSFFSLGPLWMDKFFHCMKQSSMNKWAWNKNKEEKKLNHTLAKGR